MNIVSIIAISVCFLGILFLVSFFKTKRDLGSLASKHVYADTDFLPGEVLYSQTLPLYGKPDYILHHHRQYVPVEIKRGRTPPTPYENHIFQLLAYCVLVEEVYGSRPKLGIIKYPEKEFEIPFTKEYEAQLRALIAEMVAYKKGRKPFVFSPAFPFLCRECKAIV